MGSGKGWGCWEVGDRLGFDNVLNNKQSCCQESRATAKSVMFCSFWLRAFADVPCTLFSQHKQNFQLSNITRR